MTDPKELIARLDGWLNNDPDVLTTASTLLKEARDALQQASEQLERIRTGFICVPKEHVYAAPVVPAAPQPAQPHDNKPPVTVPHPMLEPTHICKDCGAAWRQCDDFTFNLRSPTACAACDNTPVGGQLLPLMVPSADDVVRAAVPADVERDAASLARECLAHAMFSGATDAATAGDLRRAIVTLFGAEVDAQLAAEFAGTSLGESQQPPAPQHCTCPPTECHGHGINECRWQQMIKVGWQQPPAPSIPLDAAGNPKLAPTLFERLCVKALNEVKAWRDSDGNEAFPHGTRQVIDALLMMYEQRRYEPCKSGDLSTGAAQTEGEGT